MPAHRLLPDNAALRRYVEAGMTHQQIADHVYETTGRRVSRSTVSAAIHRAGLSHNLPRYSEEIPWRVKSEHITEYPARMLRLLGRRRSGVELNPTDNQRLDSWLAKLEDDNAVVAYSPSSEYGFYYIEKDTEHDGADGIPIRRQTVEI